MMLWKITGEIMTKQKFTVIVEDAREGGYSGRCLELPAAISQGETLDELKNNMTEAIKVVLGSIKEETKYEKTISFKIIIKKQ